MQAAGGVEDDQVIAATPGLGYRLLGDGLHGPGARVEVDLLPLGQDAKLLDRGRSPEIQRGHQGLAALAASPERQLDRGRGLAGALQAREQDDRGRRGRPVQALGVGPQHLDQLVVHDLDHLLGGVQVLFKFGAGELHADALLEVLDDLVVDVGLEQGHAHLAQAGLDVFGAQHATPGELAQRRRQAIAEGIEHLGKALQAPPEAVQLLTPPPVFVQQAQLAVVLLEGLSAAADEVVHCGTRGFLASRHLRQRPIPAQIQLENAALMLGEESAVPFEEGDLAFPRGQAVKGHALTTIAA